MRFTRPAFLTLAFCAAAIAPFAIVGGAAAQRGGAPTDADNARAALERAQADAREARSRGEALEEKAQSATQALEKTANERAALAARIQQSEAEIAGAEARLALIAQQQDALERRLGERRGPLIRLTGALTRFSRRPIALSALRPGSVRETVYLQAMLESTLPEVRKRTEALRAEIERGRNLELQAEQALAGLRDSEQALETRRKRLAALESRQRLASRQAGGAADREQERALSLAEDARDLDSLVEQLDEAGTLREELAALPGPMLRPANPQDTAQTKGSNRTIAASPSVAAGAPAFSLPVAGRTIAGYGERAQGGSRSTGITLRPRPGALVTTPAPGRVAFAGNYRGYGRIVIVEHPGGWTSLVTGLARTDTAVGETLVAGAPLGVATIDNPAITLEIRRNGTVLNPLEVIR
ncbi:peptidoglycan DD-metalloendopeptidase family protein [Qipengyuania sp. JC766]|uniref:murein hydrolase activator EnvC family protein n=1 Tax=Qipengyuania sp. JC766 TaxID=3232139 RepID=UPI003459F246